MWVFWVDDAVNLHENEEKDDARRNDLERRRNQVPGQIKTNNVGSDVKTLRVAAPSLEPAGVGSGALWPAESRIAALGHFLTDENGQTHGKFVLRTARSDRSQRFRILVLCQRTCITRMEE